MKEYGYEMRDTRKSTNALKKVLIATIASSCALVMVITTLFFAAAKSSANLMTEAPELSIAYCPQYLSGENTIAQIKGVIYDMDSSCTLYINDEFTAETVAAGEKLEWERTYQVLPNETLSLNIEVRDADGNFVAQKRRITGTTTNNSVNTVSRDIRHADTTLFAPYPTYTKGTLLVKDTEDYNSTVRVRNGAGFEFDVIGKLGVGETVVYLDDGGNGWYYVQMSNGRKGYVSAAYTKEYDSCGNYISYDLFYGCQLIKKTEHPDSNVNIRSGPGLEYKEIAVLGKGQRATFLYDNGNGWYYVEIYEGVRGYVSADYIEIQ